MCALQLYFRPYISADEYVDWHRPKLHRSYTARKSQGGRRRYKLGKKGGPQLPQSGRKAPVVKYRPVKGLQRVLCFVPQTRIVSRRRKRVHCDCLLVLIPNLCSHPSLSALDQLQTALRRPEFWWVCSVWSVCACRCLASCWVLRRRQEGGTSDAGRPVRQRRQCG